MVSKTPSIIGSYTRMVALFLKRLRQDDRGAATVEYILLISLIATVCIAAESSVRESLDALFKQIGTTISAAFHTS